MGPRWPKNPSVVPIGRIRVLMMDDMAIIRSAAGKVVVRIGYEAEQANEG
jgi:hypothetical protein